MAEKTPKKSSKRALPFSRDWTSPPPKTPRKGGQSVDISGYLLLVGQEESSATSGNDFYDLVIQRTKSEITVVRVMMKGNPPTSPEMLCKMKEQDSEGKLFMKFLSVCPSGDIYFYNETTGSSYSFDFPTPDFDKDEYRKFTVKLADVEDVITPTVNVECQVKWLSSIKISSAGDPFRNAVLYDKSGDFFAAFWNKTLLALPEEQQIYITELKVRDFFGKQLNTQRNTIAMESGGATISLSDDRLEYYKSRVLAGINTKTVAVPCLAGAIFHTILKCPTPDCIGDVALVTDKIGKCNKCGSRTNKILCKNSISGTISTSDVSLVIEEEEIDNIFGKGTASLYYNKVDDLADKFLGLEKPAITYDAKKKSVISIKES